MRITNHVLCGCGERNVAQRRTKVSFGTSVGAAAVGTSQDKVTLNSEEIKPVDIT